MSVDKEFFYEELAARHEWDSVANRYETDRRLELVFERLLAGAPIEGRRLLDVGSGGGHFSAQAEARGARVWSLDVGTNLLRQVTTRCGSRPVAGTVLDLPFRDGTFDVVLSTEVIEHTRDPRRAIDELCRVVAPGGLLVLTTPCRLWQPVVRASTWLRLRPYRGLENFLWPWDLVAGVRKHGLAVEWMGGFNFCPLFWRSLDPAFRLLDRLLGGPFPWLMVNVGLTARRPAVA